MGKVGILQGIVMKGGIGEGMMAGIGIIRRIIRIGGDIGMMIIIRVIGS